MSVFHRFTLAFFAFIFLLTIQVSAQTSAFSPEQKALLEAVLRTAVVEEKNLEDYAMLPDPEKIVLLNKMISLTYPDQAPVYITEEVLPEFEDVKFKLKSAEEIEKMKNKKDLVYLRVATIDQPESDYAVVSLLAQNKLGKKSLKKGFKYKETRGYSLLFVKKDGAWKFQKVITTFSNLIDYNPGF